MKNTQYILTILIAVLLGALPQSATSQLTQDEAANIVQLNTITTAVPFLMIAPDSRSGALGDAVLHYLQMLIACIGTQLRWHSMRMI